MSMSSAKDLLTSTPDLEGGNIPTPPHIGGLRAVGAKIPAELRECCAEFLGVLVLVTVGTGVNCQVGLSASPEVATSQAGDWISVCLAWATGVTLGVWVSGGHINPAITLVMAAHRGFPLRKVPGYILAQILGGLVGAAIVYANYFHAIDIVEGGSHIRTLKTAGYFGTYALPYMTNVSAFFSEFVATAMFTLGVLSATDKRNSLSAGLVPFALFIVTAGVGMSLGAETGFALNPARDLGPRIFTAMAGYGGEVFAFRNQYWIWCPVLATSLGAQVAAVIYDLVAASPGAV